MVIELVFLFFLGDYHDGYRDRSYCAGWRTLTPHKGNDRITWCDMVRYPRDSYIVIPIAVSGVATPENKITSLVAVIHKQESRHKEPKSVLRAVLGRGCSLPFMRLAEHLTALRAWCKQCLLVGENPTCSVSA